MVFQMSSKDSFFNAPAKLKSYKKDVAPMGFYFDIFATEIFKIPVMPVPMRIDKLTNGDVTLFIFPDVKNLNILLKKLDLAFNFKKFFLHGISNLINFAKEEYKKITKRYLKHEIIIKWFENSKVIKTEIPSFTNLYTYLLLEFLKTFSKIEEKGLNASLEKYTSKLILYCDRIIKYAKKKIENNLILIKVDGLLIKEQLYLEKKGKYYPEIISIPIANLNKNKKSKMGFIPYLIFDDILDVFSYNKKLLNEGKQIPIDMTTWKNKGIINKRSNLNHNNFHQINFELHKISLNNIL